MSMIGDSPKSVALYDTYTKGQSEDLFPLMGGVGASGVTSVQEVTGDATAVAPPFYGTSFVVVEAATATITIPEGVPVGGRVHVRKIHATQGAVTIALSGTDTITRAALTSVRLNANGDHWLLQKVSSTRWELVEGVESGSNANGEYVKYADKTMRCTKDIGSIDPVTTQTMGNIPYWADLWTFPVEFISNPATSTQGATQQDTGGRGWATHISTSSNSIVSYRHTSVGIEAFNNVNRVAYTAIGRWY